MTDAPKTAAAIRARTGDAPVADDGWRVSNRTVA